MDESTKRKKSLNRRIIINVAILMAVVAVFVAVLSYLALENTYMRLYSEKAQDIVRNLASRIDPEKIVKYEGTDDKDDYYNDLWKEMNRCKQDFTGIQYLYIFRPFDDHFVYIMDAIKPGDDIANISAIGDVYEYSDMEYKYLVPDVRDGIPSDELIKGPDVGYGKTISAWAPILDKSGKTVAMVEADCVLSNLAAVVRRHAIFIVGGLVLCMAAVLGILILILRRSVTEPIGQLTEYVDSYTHGGLEKKKFRFDDEVQWLANSFYDMTSRIEAYNREVQRVTAEKERIGAELNVATQIQADMLPRIFPAFPDRSEFDLYATMEPAKEVGGDFYDFFLIDEDHIALVMADVSGKGVPAALFMVIAKTLIKNRALLGENPSEILKNVNNQLCEGNEAELFVTVWLAVIEISTGKGLAANAGHEHPVIRRKDGQYELVVYRHSPAVATMEGVRFKEHEFEMHPGDTLFVYTDGVPEATNASNELFGTDRMLEALNREPDAAPEKILSNVRESVDAFVGEAPQFDDITMLGFVYKGTPAAPDELTLEAKDENLDKALAFVDGHLETLGCSMKTQMQIDVAVEELFVNVAHYAYTPNTGTVTLRFEKKTDPLAAEITLIDSGIPYDPLAKKDPDVTLSAEERQIGGLGIYMVKKSMDDVRYQYTDGKNVLTIRKVITQ